MPKGLTVNVQADTTQLDETIEKLSRLKELLGEANDLIGSMCDIHISVSAKVIR